MIDIFDGRCALINKKGVCHQCSELNGVFNPKQDTQEELQKINLVKEAEKGGKEYLFDLRMQLLKEIEPVSNPLLRNYNCIILEHNRRVMEKHLEKGRFKPIVFSGPIVKIENTTKFEKTRSERRASVSFKNPALDIRLYHACR